MSIPLMFHVVSLQENNFIIYFMMPHYAKCDVISRENNRFKLKYLINKTLQRKSKKELVLYFKYSFTSHNNNFPVIGT